MEKISSGARNLNSVHLYVAGTGVQVHQHAAVSDFALDMVVRQRALHGDRVIYFERSGRSTGVNVE